MSSRLTIPRTALPSIRALLRMVNGLFPPGSPISTSTFLAGTADFFGADLASLMLLRADGRYRSFVVMQGVLHSAGNALHTQFHEHVQNDRNWADDVISRRIYHRCQRRPDGAFCYSTRSWLRRLPGEQSYSRMFLDALEARHDINSFRMVEDRIYSVLTLYRTRPHTDVFGRHDRRLLSLLHEGFRDRIIDLRARRLRDELPPPVRHSFTLLLAGHTEKEIAKLTHKSPNTIHDHVKRIYKHFHVSSRAQLLARFVDVERLREFHA